MGTPTNRKTWTDNCTDHPGSVPPPPRVKGPRKLGLKLCVRICYPQPNSKPKPNLKPHRITVPPSWPRHVHCGVFFKCCAICGCLQIAPTQVFCAICGYLEIAHTLLVIYTWKDNIYSVIFCSSLYRWTILLLIRCFHFVYDWQWLYACCTAVSAGYYL